MVAASKEILMLAHAKCIKQLVLNVVRNAKFLLNPWKASQFTAETAIQKEKGKI